MMAHWWMISSLLTCLWGCPSINRQKASVLDIDDSGSALYLHLDSIKILDTLVFDLDYIMGKFEPATHPDFMLIPEKYRDSQLRHIRYDVWEAFLKMYEVAVKDGVNLRIISATRNFDHQKRIWENKWTGHTKIENGRDASISYPDPKIRALKILEYSSMPGTSRHHWGTDMDFNALNNTYFEAGEGLKVYQWLVRNAHQYGFCQPYTHFDDERRTGYQAEKWHWTYMPVAYVIQKAAQHLLTDKEVKGFLGAETAIDIEVVTNYVGGIHPSCYNNN